MELNKVVDAISHLGPGANAVWFEDRWYTWAEINAVGDAMLEMLDTASIRTDESIGVIVRNDPLCVGLLLGAMRAGRPVLTFSPLLPDRALADDVTANRPAVLVGRAPDWQRHGLRDAVAAGGALGISLGDDSRVTSVDGTAYRAGEVHFVAPAGTAANMLTSGTTGPPKRLAVTLAGLAHAIESANRHHGGDNGPEPELRLRDATSIIDLPLFNISAYLDLPTIVSAGRRICLLRRFEPMAWGRAVRDHRVVVALLVPAAMRMVLDAGVPKEWLQSLKVVRSGSAPLDPELAAAFEHRFDIPVIVAYGATEFSGALASLTVTDRKKWGAAKRGTVGRAHPEVELRIVDQVAGHNLAAGEVGVLLARAPQIAGTEPGGWARTNDLARIDEDGFLFIMGRADDVIIRGGFKVHPGDVAGVLRQHPDVADAAVVGLPDARLGHVPAAAVVLRDGTGGRSAAALQHELQEWVRDRLAVYAVPVVIRGVDALPRTATMKIAQATLVDLLQN